LVVSAGFAGALVADLARGDLVVAQNIVDTSGRTWDAEPGTLPRWLAEVPRLHLGRLLTTDRIIRLPEEKLSLGRQHVAVAVDMESFAVAEVCRERGAAFLGIRIINDATADELPPDVERLVAQKTQAARLGAALGAIWRRPSSLKDMLGLQRRAIEDADRLARVLLRVIATASGAAENS
jgi:adenosylhomocysteine nucleosidase